MILSAPILSNSLVQMLLPSRTRTSKRAATSPHTQVAYETPTTKVALAKLLVGLQRNQQKTQHQVVQLSLAQV